MSLVQASASAKLKRGAALGKSLRRDGNDDLWATLDEKLAEREAHQKDMRGDRDETSRDNARRPKGWFRQLVDGIGLGER